MPKPSLETEATATNGATPDEVTDEVALTGTSPLDGAAGTSDGAGASPESSVTGVAADEPEPPGDPKQYRCIPYPGPTRPLPEGFVRAVWALEKSMGMPVWLLLQSGDGDWGTMGDAVWNALFQQRHKLPKDGPVALLLDSPGGIAKSAYQIATLFRRQCGEFSVVVPRYAKSAATLLALGADSIILGEYAELGPLDAQFLDRERETWRSALDEVQALERLNASALVAVDETMQFLLRRTGKKVDTTLSASLQFTTDMMRPLLEKIDTVHYTQMSRVLKVAEEYAIRLLKPRYSEALATNIARSLVENYPEHGFVIDAQEAGSIGLETHQLDDAEGILDALAPFMGQVSAIGRLEVVPT